MLDLTDLKESYREEFLRYIDSFPSPKVDRSSFTNTLQALYWEQCLLARIGSIVSHTTLKVWYYYLCIATRNTVFPTHSY